MGWSRVLGRAARFLEAEELVALAGARERVGSVLLALLLALPGSGVVRHLTGLPFGPSLLVALALTLPAAVGSWPLLRGGASIGLAPALLFAVLAATYCGLQLYNPYFDGFPALSGGDAGLHVWRQRAFEATGQNDYVGMISLYSVSHWLEAIGLDSFGAQRLAFYLVVSGLILFAASAGRLLVSAPSRIDLPHALLLLAATLVPAHFVALPLLHYYQCDGFLPQVFGLLPLLLGLWLYACSELRLGRLLGLGLGAAALRFSYLLNLGDLLLASAALAALEARDRALRPGARQLLWLFASGLLGAAVLVYLRIAGVAQAPGGFHRSSLPLLLGGTLLLGAVLLFAPWLLARARLGSTPGATRLLRAIGLLALLGGGVPAIWLCAGGDPQSYYAQKYPFASAVIASLGAGFLLALVVLGAASRAGGRRATLARLLWAAGLVAAVALPIYLLGRACAPYRSSLDERASGAPPWRRLRPLADRRAWTEIRRLLAASGARFGGLITPRWAESQFSNASLGLPPSLRSSALFASDPPVALALSQDAIFRGALAWAPGHCLFWFEPGSLGTLPHERLPPEAERLREELRRSPERRCRDHHPRHDPARRVTLCELCFRGIDEPIPLGSRSVAVALSGFYPLEGEGAASFRWTDGAGRISLQRAGLDRYGSCHLLLDVHAPSGMRLRWNGVELGGAGPARPIPRPARLGRERHLLELGSPTIVPAELGPSTDRRRLGVMVRSLRLRCTTP